MAGGLSVPIFRDLLVSMSWADIAMQVAMDASGGMPGPGASVGTLMELAMEARSPISMTSDVRLPHGSNAS